MKYVIPFHQIGIADIALVGGKNASLGEMIQHLAPKGIQVPTGFAISTTGYHDFLAQGNLEQKISAIVAKVNTENIAALQKVSQQIQRWIMDASLPAQLIEEVSEAYAALANKTVAARSSATAEDLAHASFAGQQDTFLNIKGIKNVLHATKAVFASLFNSRAIAYRHHQNFDFGKIGISVGIQSMVRADKGCSGVLFTLDTESGFDKVVLITATYGLGETLVQGKVNPDEFYVHKPMLEAGKSAILRRSLGEKAIKMVYTTNAHIHRATKIVSVPTPQRKRFCLSDSEIHSLAQQAVVIEKHYGKPMDIEWGKDGLDGKLYILQARPETVKSHKSCQILQHYILEKKGKIVTSGRSVGQGIGQGRARIITHIKQLASIQKGDVLVTDITDPDWEPAMRKVSAIVTNRGGRTCHAAIVAREMGIPAVIGCQDATSTIKEKAQITVSCAEGDAGFVYAGKLPYRIESTDIQNLPALPVRLCLNIGNPDKAFTYQFLPNDGVGLARLEFIIGNTIGIHPNALLHFKTLPSQVKKEIQKRIHGYKNPVEFYIEKLKEGIATIAAAFYPKEVIFRFSDFKSNEYSHLLGGELFEPKEENPMLGFRGASRYIAENFEKCFELECIAFKRVREEMGLTNAQVMVPFVRTIRELNQVLVRIQKHGLKRGEHDLKIYMMCEIPSNALLAEAFLENIDGFSIGSNDLTQLTLGLDRDSAVVSEDFDERDAAVKFLLERAISACNKAGKYIGICGQGPSDHPDLAQWLLKANIGCISLNPDTIVKTWLALALQQENLSKVTKLQPIGILT